MRAARLYVHAHAWAISAFFDWTVSLGGDLLTQDKYAPPRRVSVAL